MPTDPISDEQLAQQSQKGSLSAFDELVRRHGKRMFYFLNKKTGDSRNAEEIAQNTFIVAHRKIHQFRPKHAFITWLFAIARRQAIDHYRQNKRHADLTESRNDEIPLAVDARTPASLLSDKENHAALWGTIRELVSDDHFTVLWLKYEEDFPVSDIAVAMKKTKTHVKVMLHRARQRLIEHLPSPIEGSFNGHSSPAENSNIPISQP